MSSKKSKAPAKKGLVAWIFDFAGEKKRTIPLECVLCPFKCSVLYCTLFYRGNCSSQTCAACMPKGGFKNMGIMWEVIK